ncbi:hypothetical protein B7P43_G15356, partial [Cryptotermes secundus]
PAEDISEGLENLGFDVVSVKQMTTTRRSQSEEAITRDLPLFLITLPRTAKSQEIFNLPSLCHISIKVEMYRAQTGLTQCHNCQQFGHIWTNCKQPPSCLWCGGSHLHKECPEKGKSASTPTCYNCQLAEGDKPRPTNYRGCRHAREESEVLLAAVYKSPGRAWSDANITELLSFRRKSILAGDLNAKNSFWNRVSNPSGLKLMDLFDMSDFEIPAPQNLSEPIEKFTDWEQFQSLTSELISPKLEINSGVEADKVAHNFAASIASAYRLSTSKITLSDINNDLPCLAIHGAAGIKFHPFEKASATADCLENQYTPHNLFDDNHERRVEARVQALFKTTDNKPPQRIRPCDIQKLINSLKLRKACGIDSIPNECLRQLPRRPLVHLTRLFNRCLQLSHFPNTWKEAKVITLPKSGKDLKFPQNLRPISLLSTTGKLFEKVILKFLRKHIEERGLLDASQFGFRACHSKTLQCKRLADHMTLNFNNKMSTAAVFLDIKKAFNTTWHSYLLYKLTKLEFSNSLTKLIGSFLSKRKFMVLVEGQM